MRTVFKKRRRAFHLRCLGYLRYVLNDHFVLILFVLLGFLAYQYRQILVNFPQNPVGIYALLAFVSVFFLLLGHPATFLEAADPFFVLAKEEEVKRQVKRSTIWAILLWNILQLLGQLIFLPLYLRLQIPLWGILLYFLLLFILKTLYHWGQVRTFEQNGIFQWDRVIQTEKKRQQRILQFFALFTNVKGMTSTVKRRSYLDSVLRLLDQRSRKTWSYLYRRAFFRSGDFWRMSLRLFVLALLVLTFVSTSWLALLLAALFNYLMWFQLASLAKVYDYQYLTQLYPLEKEDKRKGLIDVIRLVTYVFVGIEVILGFFVLAHPLYSLCLLVLQALLNQLYLPVKVKKVIDERGE
ncbi:ABC transporter permease, partial [Streptococcus sp. DD13]|uniref:ABC transporter permease n=1 Tax=Streptococcus sp. DD13 TaxID=1777881 RepID=UPI00082FD37F